MKSDASFTEALRESQSHVAKVAAWMTTHNCDVMIRPTVLRPDFESRNDFADCGDIEIRQRVEVKQRSIDFTSCLDYPYATVIVDEQFKIDRIPRGRLWGYVILNKAGTHVCCIKPDTKPHWTVESKYDKKDAQQRNFYVCPIAHCSFCSLNP